MKLKELDGILFSMNLYDIKINDEYVEGFEEGFESIMFKKYGKLEVISIVSGTDLILKKSILSINLKK